MNINDIKALAEIFSTHNLTVLDVTEGETRVLLKKENAHSYDAVKPQAEIAPRQEVIQPQTQTAMDFDSMNEVRSPIVGVFYAAPSPDSPPYVTIGSKVKKGDVLCIIEAMKMINEIVSEYEGEIVDICVKNGDIAEYGQVLFKII